MSETRPETFEEFSKWISLQEFWPTDREAFAAGRASRDPEVLNDDYWDQHAVQCGNCSVEILTRKGSIPNNSGLSDTHQSEDESLCGRCAGEEMYRLMDINDNHDFVCGERDAAREQVRALREALMDMRPAGSMMTALTLNQLIDAALSLSEAQPQPLK